MPKISVLLPIYNALPYLREALESILNQSFGDFEVLALDDSSTDGSSEYLDSVNDPRLRVLHLAKAGYTTNLNIGLENARAEIIARMDADDVSLPTRFEKQYSFLETNPGHVACSCLVRAIDEAGLLGHIWDYPLEDEAIRFALLHHNPISHPGSMFRRDAALQVGGYRPEYEPSEDYDFWCRMSRVGRLANLSEVLVHYRIHPRSVSVSRRELQIDATRRARVGHAVRLGLAESEDECDAFWRCTPSATERPSVHDAVIFGRVASRFLKLLESEGRGLETIAAVRREIRGMFIVLGLRHPRFTFDRLRLLALGIGIDPSLRSAFSFPKWALCR